MKKIVLFIIIVIVLICGIFIFKSNDNIDAEEIEVEKKTKLEDTKSTKIKVDLKGFVLNPNVYEIDDGARIIDVINIAGGLTEDADTSSINLSKKLKDEDVIIIYQKSDEVNTLDEYKQQIAYCSKDNNDGCVEEVTTFNQENDITENESTIININTATLQQLMSLSGIGESKAKNIIKYREENGAFNSIEDIKNVTGIGDSIFEKIKDNITV